MPERTRRAGLAVSLGFLAFSSRSLAAEPPPATTLGPPAPTAEQSRQLNEAEDMLDNMAENEEGPEANASGPSNSSD